MSKTRNFNGGIHSSVLVSEVEKRPCLYDSNHRYYNDKNEKSRCWEEVSQKVVPGWVELESPDRLAAVKMVQTRWRSIRDAYTKAYRRGRCVLPEQCAVDSSRYQYHKQMSFLFVQLEKKKSRNALKKDPQMSNCTSSEQQNIEEIQPKVKNEIIEQKMQNDVTAKPLDLKKEEKPKTPTVNVSHLENNRSVIGIHPYFDDKMFMYSLVPLFEKMNDDTRLLCAQTLKIIRLALQAQQKYLEELRSGVDHFIKNRISDNLMKRKQVITERTLEQNESTLPTTSRSANGSGPVRKRKSESPSQAPNSKRKRVSAKKIHPPSKKCSPELKVVPKVLELDESISKATSVANLTAAEFMKVFKLQRPNTKLKRRSLRIMWYKIRAKEKSRKEVNT